MTALIYSFYPSLDVVDVDRTPATRGPMLPVNGYVLARQRLATDSIGNLTLTLTNVVVGSAIQIEDQAGTTTIHNSVAASSTVVVVVPAYTTGNALNDLRIKVRKGSASPTFKPFETLTTAFVGAASLYVSQIPDE